MVYNVDVDEEEGVTIVTVNPRIYWMDSIYAAAYAITDRAYVYVTGDPEREVFVILRPKYDSATKSNLQEIGLEFNNYLISFQAYYTQAQYVASLREQMIRQAAGTAPPVEDYEDPNTPSEKEMDSRMKMIGENAHYDPEATKQFLINDPELDPEGIAVPWEEKYGGQGKECKE